MKREETKRTWPMLAKGAGAALLASVSMLALDVSSAGAAALAANPPGSGPEATTLDVVIVTARKREEAINTIPMSISAIGGRQLAQQGIVRLSDLGRAVPGFTYTHSQVGTPIYTLRGVGFVDISMGGRPTVSVYADQAPVPFTIETLGGNLDLDRIEVLKGPQGTLFGQNSTGGAINLIPTKPTQTFEGGAEVSYGNYNALSLGGYVSGPITSDLSARLALRHDQNDGWQKSVTTGETNGVGDLTTGRLLLDWKPTDKLKVELNLNGFLDRSDSQAAQTTAVLNLPASAVLIPALGTYPLAPHNDRAADWNPGQNYRRDNGFFQANLRGDYDLPHGLTLTSLTSYSHYTENQPIDIDGTPLSGLQQLTIGSISSWYEELRVSGHFMDRGYFVVGGNYSSDIVRETNYDDVSGSTEAFTFVGFNLPEFKDFRDSDNQNSESYAVFGNVDYDLTDTVKLNAGVRYTHAIDHFNGCSSDTGDGNAALLFGSFWNIIRGSLSLPPNPAVPPGGCVSANAQFTPQLVVNTLDEDNVSWRAGLEWKVWPKTMLYVNVSQGYKAGGFPDLGATNTSQYLPARQESLLAYEAGFKSTLFENTLQLNGAGFYYDYRDKQVLGSVSDPLFGRLLRLINIPKSQILGAELQATWAPVHGLTIGANASYIDSEILDHFTNYNPFGQIQDFGGEAFPNTPTWQFAGNVHYRWPLNDRLYAFGEANVSYKSATNNALGEEPLLAIKAYALADLSAGVESSDGNWRAWVWVRNLGDTYYWTGAYIDTDTAVRYAGMPRTFGVTLSAKFQ